jgi:hypothetical protein
MLSKTQKLKNLQLASSLIFEVESQYSSPLVDINTRRLGYEARMTLAEFIHEIQKEKE